MNCCIASSDRSSRRTPRERLLPGADPAVNPALHCDVRRRYPVALIVVTGDLRLDTAHLLRAAVLKVLADQPTAVVVDLLAVDVVDPAAATVLPLIEQHAAHRAL